MGQKPTLGFSDLAKVSFSTSLLRYPLDGNKKSFPDSPLILGEFTRIN